MSEDRTGLVYAVLSALLFAVCILMAKSMLATMTPWALTAFGYGLGAVWFTLYFVAQRDRVVFRPSRALLAGACVVGVLDVGATLTMFSALRILSPGVYAFFSHMSDLLTVIVGVAFLRERFTGRALVGLAIAFAGLVILTARADGQLLDGFLLMLASAAFYAVNAIAIKRYTKLHSPIHLAYYRNIVLASLIFLLTYPIVGYPVPRGDQWWWLAVIGLVGPFLNYWAFVNAVKRLPIGRVSVVRMCYSVLVVLGAYGVYAQLPSDRQLAGGLTLLVGVALVLVDRGRVSPARSAS